MMRVHLVNCLSRGVKSRLILVCRRLQKAQRPSRVRLIIFTLLFLYKMLNKGVKKSSHNELPKLRNQGKAQSEG